MKNLKVLPNFTVMATVDQTYLMDLAGWLALFCERISTLEKMDTLRLTPASFWSGMNRALSDEVVFGCPNPSFLSMLEEHSESIPENVRNEIKKWTTRYGLVTLVGEDCLRVSDETVLTEMKSSSKISPFIYSVEGSLVFFSGVSVPDLQDILERELGTPIMIHVPKSSTVVVETEGKVFAVKGKDQLSAVRGLYTKHIFTESNLREKLGLSKAKISEENILHYFSTLMEEGTVKARVLPHRITIEAIEI